MNTAIRKTYKRETAVGVLLAYWANVLAVAYGYTTEAAIAADLLKTLAMPVHALAAGMFGIDWYGKRID